MAVLVVQAVIVLIALALGAVIIGIGITVGWNLRERTEMQRRRYMPYHASAGIMDAIAVLMDAEMDADISRLRYDKARRILGELLKDPHGYDPDRPAGERPKKG